MSDSSAFGFGKFIPGFEFLQSLGGGQGATATPPFSHWVAPTMRIEDIDKRINELKAVQFWLEQNSRALAATVQALEVQKMTLSTLKGMNVNFADMAKGFPFASTGASETTASPATADASATTTATTPISEWPMTGAAPQTSGTQDSQATAAARPKNAAAAEAETSQTAPSASMMAASQWWGALTQQFQQIAQQAMQDPVQQQAIAQATQMTTEFAKTAVKAANDMVKQAVAKTKAAPKKQAAAKPSVPVKPKAAPNPAAKSAGPSKRSSVQKSASTDKQATSLRGPRAASAKKQSVARKTPTR